MKNIIAQCNFIDLHAEWTKSATNRWAPMGYQWCKRTLRESLAMLVSC